MEGHFKLKKLLGSGAFGVVYLAVRARKGARKEGEKFAVKVLPKALVPEEKTKLDTELDLQTRAGGHRNVVEAREVSREKLKGEEFVCIRMDLCDDGDMARAIEKGVFNKEEQDLKPENVLVSVEDKDVRVKIADFGLATNDKVCYGLDFPGTPKYMPPETVCPKFIGRSHSPALQDVWAIGFMLAGVVNDDPLLLGQYLPHASNELVRVLRRSVLTPDPSERISLLKLRDFVETAPLFKGNRREGKGFLAKIFKV
ncbi:hypothetical protein VKT23_007361 [Stygiomarasmius scandens]|uniref:Protein kinase domain-containing protein n=1 Tax=Marasmiellus scandens TaxID=2682957 RepID=A0ABR1JKG2_9AGAR